ncbi:hypothetical protein GCM10018772_67190 [Streptomyces fumanus]|uniref:Uncharacterized protein n=1 Tax=Streptomyces fumanus TaxID=67302 RepID=A0A919E9P3_9ACTN|nr:hypothetical protein GCM10018772_67190 [Streptomyces fumanus]
MAAGSGCRTAFAESAPGAVAGGADRDRARENAGTMTDHLGCGPVTGRAVDRRSSLRRPAGRAVLEFPASGR